MPTVILARTLKGKGVSFLEGAPNWHGKALKKGDELERAIKELEAQLMPEAAMAIAIEILDRPARPREERVGNGRAAVATSSAISSRRAKRTAPRSRGSAPPTRASSRSTPT